MNQRKAKKINRIAGQLIQAHPDRFQDEIIHHGYHSPKPGVRYPVTQRISGKRKAKRDAKLQLG